MMVAILVIIMVVIIIILIIVVMLIILIIPIILIILIIPPVRYRIPTEMIKVKLNYIKLKNMEESKLIQ